MNMLFNLFPLYYTHILCIYILLTIICTTAQFLIHPFVHRKSRYILGSFIMRNKDYPAFFLIVLPLGRDRRLPRDIADVSDVRSRIQNSCLFMNTNDIIKMSASVSSSPSLPLVSVHIYRRAS